MPTVFVEGVGRVTFPDSMTPAQIEAEIKRIEPPAKRKAPEMGAIEQFGRGALQSVTDVGYGVRQLGAEAGAALGLVRPETVQRLREEQDVRQLIKHKNVYEYLENAIDKCQDVALVIEGVVLENG